MTEKQVFSEEAAVREVIERWAAAVRRKNIDGILENHSTDVVMFDVPPPFESRGIDAYRKTWDTFFSWASGEVLFEIVEMRVTAGSDVAFAFARMRCFGPDAKGEPKELAFRLTTGLRRIDARWMIVHEHHSIPAEN